VDADGLFALSGRRALVTGGATGIGQAIAVGFGAAGADLVLVSDRDDLAETRDVVAGMGRDVRCLVLDLRDADAVGREVGRLLGEAEVDILVNNAGIIRRAPAVDLSGEAWRAVLDVNLDAAFRLSQLVAPPMLARGRGKIINMASLLSFQGGLHAAAYTASKHAVAGVTKALANEWAPHGVQVNAIAPGYIETAVTAALRADPVRRDEILGRIPAGRWGRPRDVAGAALFLASSAADYVTGHVLVVDGGWLAR
jgi:2-dehydro-3-deoxy-D-gluconate 5-dehydrogenase